MIKGVFSGNTPLIKIPVGWGQSVQTPFVVLDTGFTGDLQVSSKIANELGLEVIGVTKVRIATGQIIHVPVAIAYSGMEGTLGVIEVLISEGMPLAGIGFFSKFGYKAIIDCKNKNIVLEKVI